MKIKHIISLIFLISISISSFSQKENNKYAKVDSLLPFPFVGIDNQMEDNKDELIFNLFLAKQLLNNELSAYKNESAYWEKKAIVSFVGESYDDAKKHAEKALLLNPENHLAKLIQANINLLKSNYPELALKQAIKVIDSITKQNKRGEYFFQLGICNTFNKDTLNALNNFDNALKYGYTNCMVYFMKMNLLYYSGKYKEALIPLNKAITLKPKIAFFYSLRSTINMNLLNLDYIDDMKKAADLGDEGSLNRYKFVTESEGNPYHLIACFLSNLEKFDIAIAALNYLIDEQKIDSSTYYADRGYYYFSNNQYDKAEKDLIKALTLPTDSTTVVYSSLVELYIAKENYEKAFHYNNIYFNKDSLNPGNGTLRQKINFNFGVIFLGLKKYKTANEYFNRHLILFPFDYEAIIKKGISSYYLNQYNEAFKDFNDVLRFDNSNILAHYYMAATKIKLNKDDFCLDLVLPMKYEMEDTESIYKLCK